MDGLSPELRREVQRLARSEAETLLKDRLHSDFLRARSVLPQKIRPTDLDGARPSDGSPLVYSESSDLVTFDSFTAGARVASGTYSTATTTGNASITGVGFTPKALITMGAGPNASTNFQTGFALTTGSHAGAVAMFATNTGPDHAGGKRADGSIFWLVNGAGADVKNFTWVSFDADGFTFNRVTNDATAYEMYWLAIG